jgi:hypothetical protein
MVEKEKMVADLKVTEKSNEITKFDNFTSIEDMLKLAEVMIKTKLIPITLKQPEQVVAVILQGKELGFNAVTSLNNIHNIQGRATLGVHAIAALLKRKGITYKLIEDGVFVKEDGTVDKVKLANTSYKDRRTTIRFYENFHGKIIENDISFTLKEAQDQELLKKSNWKRMPLIMLRARALAIGARFVAPDALLGMYETSEWADIKNQDYNIDEEGKVTLITN